MNYDILLKTNEINTELSYYEETIYELQKQIEIEKNKSKTNLSILGKLRYKLRNSHNTYCNLYLMKYEI